MSDFINRLTEKVFSDRPPVRKAIYDNFTITESHDHSRGIDFRSAREHRFNIEWGVTYYCEDSQIARCKLNAIAQLNNEVYGEFRSKLMYLRHELYNREYDKCIQIVDDLFKEISI